MAACMPRTKPASAGWRQPKASAGVCGAVQDGPRLPSHCCCSNYSGQSRASRREAWRRRAQWTLRPMQWPVPLRSTGTASCSTTAWTGPRDPESSEVGVFGGPPKFYPLASLAELTGESISQNIHLTAENDSGLNYAIQPPLVWIAWNAASLLNTVSLCLSLSLSVSLCLSLCMTPLLSLSLSPIRSV